MSANGRCPLAEVRLYYFENYKRSDAEVFLFVSDPIFVLC